MLGGIFTDKAGSRIRHGRKRRLYRHVTGRDVGCLGDVIRARESRRLPVVMTREEVKAVPLSLSGDKWLMASLMDEGIVKRVIQKPSNTPCYRRSRSMEL